MLCRKKTTHNKTKPKLSQSRINSYRNSHHYRRAAARDILSMCAFCVSLHCHRCRLFKWYCQPWERWIAQFSNIWRRLIKNSCVCKTAWIQLVFDMIETLSGQMTHYITQQSKYKKPMFSSTQCSNAAQITVLGIDKRSDEKSPHTF